MRRFSIANPGKGANSPRGGNQLRFVNALVDLRGDARDALGIKFFQFHADFGKFGKIVY